MEKPLLSDGKIQKILIENKKLKKENRLLKKEIAEKEKIEANLVTVNEELEHFAIMVCHELQQPLGGTANFIRLLEKRYKEKLDDNARIFINNALNGIDTISALLRALLEFSKFPLTINNLKEVNLNSVMQIILSSLSEVIEDTGAEITYDDLPEVNSNSIQMIQVLMNLINNSLKYNRDGERPKIHISVKQEKDFWVFSVTDNGIGINSKYFNDIFRMFKRIDSAKVHAGDGIGLTIVKKIIEGHNGKIWLESEVGKGSTFFFTIPVNVNELNTNIL
jgi:light-regulated signal transduction histidine kinase (bacteriophytochrome)